MFDRGATRKPSSVYTIRVTTPDRETFFLERHGATKEKHTTEWINNPSGQVRVKLCLRQILSPKSI